MNIHFHGLNFYSKQPQMIFNFYKALGFWYRADFRRNGLTSYLRNMRKKRQVIVELQTLIDNGEQSEVDVQKFLRNVRKYTDPKELTAEILNDLVDKI